MGRPEEERDEALAELAPRLPDELLERALAATEAIADDGARARALGALAPRLPESERTEALRAALAAAEAIADEEKRASGLAESRPICPTSWSSAPRRCAPHSLPPKQSPTVVARSGTGDVAVSAAA